MKDVIAKSKKSFDDLRDTVFKLQKIIEDREKTEKDQGNTIKKLLKASDDLKK